MTGTRRFRPEEARRLGLALFAKGVSHADDLPLGSELRAEIDLLPTAVRGKIEAYALGYRDARADVEHELSTCWCGARETHQHPTPAEADGATIELGVAWVRGLGLLLGALVLLVIGFAWVGNVNASNDNDLARVMEDPR